MRAYQDVGKRIRERLLELGYARVDGQPDVQRFCWDFRYDRTLVYAWLAEKATPFKDLIRLTRDLECSAEWLLTGEERHQGKAARRQGRRVAGSLLLACVVGTAELLAWPSAGVQAAAGTLPAVQIIEKAQDTLSLIGRRLASWARRLLSPYRPVGAAA